MARMRLQGKVALVTGAGTGMGAGIARLFASEGARVVVNYRASEVEASQVVERITAEGGEAFALQADVAVEAEVARMIGTVEQRWGRLDYLVNNAGWSQVVSHGDLDALNDEIWDRTLAVNLKAPFYCVRQAVDLMRRSGGGAVVNNASASAYHAAGSSIAYSAAKAGVVNMTRSLARALAPDIRVNAFAPGLVETRFAGWPAEVFERGRETALLGDLVSVEDIARTALFLAVDATGMTGETILVDGGKTNLGTKPKI